MNFVVLLAAGVGSRLLPITKSLPKCLVNVCGRKILDYQISGYINAGIPEQNIICIIGHFGFIISSYILCINTLQREDKLYENR